MNSNFFTDFENVIDTFGHRVLGRRAKKFQFIILLF